MKGHKEEMGQKKNKKINATKLWHIFPLKERKTFFSLVFIAFKS